MPPAAKRAPRRQTYVALVRGINVGGRRKVAMADLRALVAEVGAEDVATYVQSGNVILKSRERPAQLAPAIEREIERALGLQVRVVLRTQAQLAKIVAGNPFTRDRQDPTNLYVTFLAERPDRERVRELEEQKFEPERFRISGEEIFLLYPSGYGRSKVTNALFEKQLGVAATTRNWRTVTRLAELASQ